MHAGRCLADLPGLFEIRCELVVSHRPSWTGPGRRRTAGWKPNADDYRQKSPARSGAIILGPARTTTDQMAAQTRNSTGWLFESAVMPGLPEQDWALYCHVVFTETHLHEIKFCPLVQKNTWSVVPGV